MKILYIGRNPKNDIVIADMSVSDCHGEITIEDNGQIIYTDHSSNGTYINGLFIQHNSQLVTVGDHIVFPGGMEFNWAILSGYLIPKDDFTTSHDATDVNYSEEDNSAAYVASQGAFIPNDNYDPEGKSTGEKVTLNFSLTFKEGFSSGLKNVFSLLAIILLTILTCWIPYINLGVLIALTTLPNQWSKGEIVSPLSIFNSCYRRNMGTYLLLMALLGLGILLAFLFGVIPGIVLSFAWSLAPLFVVVAGKTPIEALNVSNNCTYGSKWSIFAVLMVFSLCSVVITGLISGLFYLILVSMESATSVAIVGTLGGIILLVFTLIIYSIIIGIKGSIWKQLKQNTNN